MSLQRASVAELEQAAERCRARLRAIDRGAVATPDSRAVTAGALRRIVAELRARGEVANRGRDQ